MSDDAVLDAIAHDDGYVADGVLASHDGCRTERAHRADEPDVPLVVKRIRRDLVSEDAWEVLSRLESPRIPRVTDVYWLPDSLVVVSEWVDGEALRDLVARRLRLDAREVAVIVADVAAALDCIHAAGLVHRDVTPGNVIVCGGRSCLIDLGIARRHDEGDKTDTTRLGTYGFAPPEQFGFAQTDARSDVYSLARLAAYMLTGTDPGKEERAFSERMDDPALVSAPLREVIDRACSFEPSARFESAGAFSRAFAEALATSGNGAVGEAQGSPAGRVVPVAPARRRRKRVVLVATLVVVVAVAAGSVVAWRLGFAGATGGSASASGGGSGSVAAATSGAREPATVMDVSGGADGFYEIGEGIAQSIADGISGSRETPSTSSAESNLQYEVGEYRLYDVSDASGGGTALAFPFTWVNTTDTTTSALKCVDFKFFQDGVEAEENVVCQNEPENRYQGIREVRPGVASGGWENVLLTSESPVEIEVYDKTKSPRQLLETITVDPKTVPHI